MPYQKKEGKFLPSVKLSARAVGWRSCPIDEWMENRPANLCQGVTVLMEDGGKSQVPGRRPKQEMPATSTPDMDW